jgi:hypothetical protein
MPAVVDAHRAAASFSPLGDSLIDSVIDLDDPDGVQTRLWFPPG